MGPRLVTITLLAVFLATVLAHTVPVTSGTSEDTENYEGDDIPSNRTEEQYSDDYPIDGTTVNVEEDQRVDSVAEEVAASDSEPENVEDRKSEDIPENDDGQHCGEPPSVNNAKIERGLKSQYSVGDVVHYSCDFGYATETFERKSECRLSETTLRTEWSPLQLLCIPRSCGDPGHVVNSQRIGSLFTFPNRVTFECDEGYKLKGVGHRYCRTTGTWSGTLPTCESIACDPPPNPDNGRVQFSSLEFGSELRYECDEGFLLKNKHTRLCSSDGVWSGDEPICQEAQCEPPVAPEHGAVQVVGGKSSVGSVAIFTCDGDRFLVGSATSKCLDNGEWLFPTPKCLGACSVPKVPNGKVQEYGRKTYKDLKEGDRIEDGSDLYLSCDRNYEPFGTKNRQEKIICSRGEWDKYPRCEPASCRGKPPPQTPNGRQVTFNSSHGAGVVYHCNNNFNKTAFGNVKCDFGTWKGITPTCKDTRCDVRTLNFKGVKRTEGKRYYKANEGFIPICENGYSPATSDKRLVCLKGEWTGHLPPCEPANCSAEPPSIQNGEVVGKFSRLHTSEVTYICEEHFVLKDSHFKVRCNFGKWIGTPPTCKDSRCHIKDLKKKLGVSVDTTKITSNGDTLQVICANGFTKTEAKPRCVDGEWSEVQPPCKEDACNIYDINNGRITEGESRKVCKIWGFNCKYITDYYEVEHNRKFDVGKELYVFCNSGFTFQGKGDTIVSIKCFHGQWLPRPVCQITGTPYHEDEAAPMANARTGTLKPSLQTTTLPTNSTVPELGQGNVNANCSCTYLNYDGILVGYAGTEKLESGALIKNGCKVRFHCIDSGFYRLKGHKELICKDCQKWQPSEYPKCVSPQLGDAIIRISGNVTVQYLPGGAVGVSPGTTIQLTCIANGIDAYPNWKSIWKGGNIAIFKQDILEGAYVIRSRVLHFNRIRPDQSGVFECGWDGHRSHFLEIQVFIPDVTCPIFSGIEDLTIHYDKGQAYNSSAAFSCKNSNSRMVGSSILTCMENGQWSGDPPECIKMCPKLPEGNGMHVVYARGQEVDSTANFHCQLPRKRVGVPFTKCKKDGNWEDPIPTCELLPCRVEDLYKLIPESVHPVVDEATGDVVPYNSSLRLSCEYNMRMVGTDNTATCGEDGKWKVNKIQCVSGCLPVERDAGMLLDPEEEFYRIGQFVTLSCLPGQILSSEVVRVMCLPGVTGPEWSAKEVPTCIPAPTKVPDEVGTTRSRKRVTAATTPDYIDETDSGPD